MLSRNCTEALSIQATVTISGSSAKLIKNDIAPLPFPPRAAKAILVHQARGEGQGEGTCSILCNVRVNLPQIRSCFGTGPQLDARSAGSGIANFGVQLRERTVGKTGRLFFRGVGGNNL